MISANEDVQLHSMLPLEGLSFTNFKFSVSSDIFLKAEDLVEISDLFLHRCIQHNMYKI